MSEQKMREEFESWCKENPTLRSYMWVAWQAACASKQKEIDRLNAGWHEANKQTLELAAQVGVMQGALKAAQCICDAIPNQAHKSPEPLGYIGRLNNQDEGCFGIYAIVRDAITITPPEALTQHDEELHKEIASKQLEIDALQAESARLNHQHANDEAANRMLSEACNNLRNRTINGCAALFSGGVRNRELYVNDVEEMILGLLKE